MTTFTITITDTHQLAGITAARMAYNASIPATIQDPAFPGDPTKMIANPVIISTDTAYMQFVMGTAAQSYAKQYNT